MKIEGEGQPKEVIKKLGRGLDSGQEKPQSGGSLTKSDLLLPGTPLINKLRPSITRPAFPKAADSIGDSDDQQGLDGSDEDPTDDDPSFALTPEEQAKMAKKFQELFKPKAHPGFESFFKLQENSKPKSTENS